MGISQTSLLKLANELNNYSPCTLMHLLVKDINNFILIDEPKKGVTRCRSSEPPSLHFIQQ